MIIFSPNRRKLFAVGMVLSISMLPVLSFTQSYSDSTQRRNVIKYDLSSNILYNKAFAFTYERLIKHNQTASLTFGSENLAGISSRIAGDDIEASESKASGYKLAADYRFYLGKENRYKAPHGVYIGPYFSYHNFDNNYNVTIDGSNGEQKGETTGKFQVTNFGVQLGYQFLIGNRWSLDLTFIGASFSNYRVKMNVNGNFDLSDSEINQALLDALKEKFPLLDDLIENGEVDQSGRIDTWGLGYRYMLCVGYAFGGGKMKK